jgi:hypothetical protein
MKNRSSMNFRASHRTQITSIVIRLVIVFSAFLVNFMASAFKEDSGLLTFQGIETYRTIFIINSA